MKTTTYCHISFDGLNDEQTQIFLHWVPFTGICGHTVIDRSRHHHTLTLLAWCSWCWTIRCVFSFNYVNSRQSTHTNTKSNSYVRTDSCYFKKDTVCNKVRYVADFAQSSVNLHYDSLRSVHTVRQQLWQRQEMLPLQLDSTVSNGLVHTGAAATTVPQVNGFWLNSVQMWLRQHTLIL